MGNTRDEVGLEAVEFAPLHQGAKGGCRRHQDKEDQEPKANFEGALLRGFMLHKLCELGLVERPSLPRYIDRALGGFSRAGEAKTRA
jgi:hypothetical protein